MAKNLYSFHSIALSLVVIPTISIIKPSVRENFQEDFMVVFQEVKRKVESIK